MALVEYSTLLGLRRFDMGNSGPVERACGATRIQRAPIGRELYAAHVPGDSPVSFGSRRQYEPFPLYPSHRLHSVDVPGKTGLPDSMIRRYWEDGEDHQT